MRSPNADVVLLHGITSSGRAWDDVGNDLARYCTVYAPTAIGHRGGEPSPPSCSLADIVDDAERYLDHAGLRRPHLVGHSLGGFTALELARRGRAASVTAISPAGFWSAGSQPLMEGLRRSALIARLARPMLKAVVSSAAGRRLWMGAALHRPETMTAQQARNVIDDQAHCTLATRLRIGDDEMVRPLDPLPCPVTVAWAEHDQILPVGTYREAVKTRMPGASFIVVPDVGHAAIVDNPELIIRIILTTINRAADRGSAAGSGSLDSEFGPR